MKLLCFTLFLLILLACRKELSPDSNKVFTDAAREYLEQAMTPEEFRKLDFANTILSVQNENYLRVGILGADVSRSFMLIKFDKFNRVEGGKRIGLDVDSSLSGKISVYSVSGDLLSDDHLTNGYIEPVLLSTNLTGRIASPVVEDQGQYESPMMMKMYPVEQPERPYTVVEYVNVQRAYDNAVRTSSGSTYYSVNRPEQKQDYSSSGSGGAPQSAPQPTILVDLESGYMDDPGDIDAFIKCFNSMSDAGAVCSVTLYSDLPVDNDPQALFDWSTNSPGHTFLAITKISGGKKMVQHIGFYPANSFKTTLTTAPIAGKFVDNADHEYNASITQPITPAQLRTMLSSISKISKTAKYSIDKYNCTNFALQVFNTVRGDDPIEPVLIHIPNTMNITGSLAPQTLYLDLLRRKKANAKDRPNISFPMKKTNTGPSLSPCK